MQCTHNIIIQELTRSRAVRNAKDVVPRAVPHRPVWRLIQANQLVANAVGKDARPDVGVRVGPCVQKIVARIERQKFDEFSRKIPKEICALVPWPISIVTLKATIKNIAHLPTLKHRQCTAAAALHYSRGGEHGAVVDKAADDGRVVVGRLVRVLVVVPVQWVLRGQRGVWSTAPLCKYGLRCKCYAEVHVNVVHYLHACTSARSRLSNSMCSCALTCTVAQLQPPGKSGLLHTPSHTGQP